MQALGGMVSTMKPRYFQLIPKSAPAPAPRLRACRNVVPAGGDHDFGKPTGRAAFDTADGYDFLMFPMRNTLLRTVHHTSFANRTMPLVFSSSSSSSSFRLRHVQPSAVQRSLFLPTLLFLYMGWPVHPRTGCLHRIRTLSMESLALYHRK